MNYFFYEDEMVLETVEEGKVTRKIKAYDEKMMMVEVYFAKDSIGSQHKHPHVQTTYCLEGSFEFTLGEEIKVITVGDTIYMPPDLIHGCRLLTEKGRLLDVFTPYREDFLKK